MAYLGFFIGVFIELPNKFHNIKYFWMAFLHFKDPVNEHFIYKHFIYKNFAMNFKICGSVGFTGWICNLDIIKATRA